MSTLFNPFPRGVNPPALAALVALLSLLAWPSEAQTTRIINSSNANFTTLQNDVNVGGNILCNFNGSITITTPLIVVSNTTIFTTNTNVVTFIGAGSNRLFQVSPNVTLTLSNLTLAGGKHVGAVGTNGTTGSVGGNGIGNAGNAGTAGGAGLGGAILNLGGTIAYNCIFLTNSATGSAGGTGGTGGSGANGVGNGGSAGAGGNGLGGAIFNMGSQLVLSNCTFDGNSAIGGAGGVGGAGGTNSFATGFPGTGGTGGMALGAGVYNSNNCVATVVGCTFEFNFCESGNSQAAGPPQGNSTGSTGPNGPLAAGGGIFNRGTNVMINSTFAQNLVVAGNGGNGGNAGNDGIGGNGGNGGAGAGGSLYNTNGALAAITNCTFANGECFGGTNGAGGSGSGTAGSSGSMGSATGANIANAGTLLFKNSLLAYPTNALNYSGAITDQGNNISTDTSAAFTQSTSAKNSAPLLIALANNGGPTPTMALGPGSPAIGRITDSSAPAIDQRGNLRPAGTLANPADSGAVESGNTLFNITGRVTTNGVGVSNLVIDASGEFETATDTNGNYILQDIDPGTYTLTVESTNLAFSPTNITFTLTSDTNFNFTGSVLTFNITGTILLGTNPYPNVNIVANGTNSLTSTTNYFGQTDTNGVYNIPGLPVGTYLVTPQPAGFFNPSNVTVQLISNTNENFAGLTATNSRVAISSPPAAGKVAINLAGIPNVVYRIQATTNVANKNSWATVTTVTNSPTGILSFQISTNGFPLRYFRAVTP